MRRLARELIGSGLRGRLGRRGRRRRAGRAAGFGARACSAARTAGVMSSVGRRVDARRPR